MMQASGSSAFETKAIQDVYRRLLEGWNHKDAAGMTKVFTANGEMLGFDGSHARGQEEIFSHLAPVFEHHPTARFVSIVKEIRFLSSEAALLRAIAGMVPPGKSDLNPNVNTHHTLFLLKQDGSWRIDLFQNTPAQFHGRPELVQQMTEELRQALNGNEE